MGKLLRWIIVILLLGVIIFLFINLFNRSKQSAPKVNNDNTPIVYEKKDDTPPKEEVVVEVPVIEEQVVEVGDTDTFDTVCAFIGVFTIAGGLFYLKSIKLINNK